MYTSEGSVAVLDFGDAELAQHPHIGAADWPEVKPIGDLPSDDYLRRLGYGGIVLTPVASNESGNTGGHQGGNSEHENPPSKDRFGDGTSADKAGNQKK